MRRAVSHEANKQMHHGAGWGINCDRAASGWFRLFIVSGWGRWVNTNSR